MRLINVRNISDIILTPRGGYRFGSGYYYIKTKDEFYIKQKDYFDGVWVGEGCYRIYENKIYLENILESKFYLCKINERGDILRSCPPRLHIWTDDTKIYDKEFETEKAAKMIYDKLENLIVSDSGIVKINEELTLFK